MLKDQLTFRGPGRIIVYPSPDLLNESSPAYRKCENKTLYEKENSFANSIDMLYNYQLAYKCKESVDNVCGTRREE